MKRRFFAVLHQPPVKEVRLDACKAARFHRLSAIKWRFRPPFMAPRADATLRRMPEGVIVTS
jgi:hypothetical protein